MKSNGMTLVNVLFINPHAYFSNHQYEMEIPTHIIYIASFLKEKLPTPVRLGFLDMMAERKIYNVEDKSFDDVNFLKTIIKNKVDDTFSFHQQDAFMVGIPCYSSFHYTKSRLVVQALKELARERAIPLPTTVVGGYHATAIPGDFSGMSVDYIVRGEGEMAFLDLAKRVSSKDHRGTRETINDGAPFIIDGKIVENLDDLPALDFTLYESYLKHYHHLAITLSRGCPNGCSFCMEENIACLKPRHLRWRTYSSQRAKVELERVIQVSEEYMHQADGEKVLGLYDPIFGNNLQWRDEILKYLADRRSGYRTWCETRVDTIKPSHLEAFKAADVHFMLGLESGSPRVLELMRKTHNPTAYLGNLKSLASRAREIGYAPIVCNLIFNFPGETRETIEETFAFLNDIIKHNAQIDAKGQFYFICPGDRIFNNMDYWRHEHGTVFYCTDWWRRDETMLAGSIIDASGKLDFLEASGLYNERLKEFYRECMHSSDGLRNKMDFLKRIRREDKILDIQVNMYEHVNNVEKAI